jgi:fructose-1-phosphate kinase PfkB-like protein
MPVRVWCFTPNPVFEIKIESPGGRAVLSAGGKAHNVARQLHCWGVPAVSVVSTPGPNWLQAARRDRVPLRQIPIRSAARTGWGLVEAPGQRLDFFTEDPHWKAVDWNRCGLFFRRMVRRGDWLVVAGSVPSGACPGWWRTLFLGLRKKGVRILVDGKGQLLREAMEGGVNWAKANLAEAEETLNQIGASRCLTAMQSLCRHETSLLITQGSRGLSLRAGKQRFSVPARKIRLRDATGSGDVVSAALVYGIRKGWEIEKVAGFAVWAGSEKAARRDAVVRRLKG